GRLTELNYIIGRLFAEAALDVMGGPGQAELIGSAGQTVCHLPAAGATLQLGEAAVIAEQTRVPTVANFRAADMAAGGQGAPLVPYADFHLLGDQRENRVCLNLGGIANVTVLPAGGSPEDVRAFDTGPGNMVIDACAAHISQDRLQRDEGGEMALRGRADQALLAELLEHPFFAVPPPKSCGREEFGEHFAARAWSRDIRSEDLLATVTALTAEGVARALASFPPIDTLSVSGGGVHNRALMAELAGRVPAGRVVPVEELGCSSDFKEALCFAVLAYAWQRRWPGNLPACTGASHPALLGQDQDVLLSGGRRPSAWIPAQPPSRATRWPTSLAGRSKPFGLQLLAEDPGVMLKRLPDPSLLIAFEGDQLYFRSHLGQREYVYQPNDGGRSGRPLPPSNEVAVVLFQPGPVAHLELRVRAGRAENQRLDFLHRQRPGELQRLHASPFYGKRAAGRNHLSRSFSPAGALELPEWCGRKPRRCPVVEDRG
ncbi:MAG: anhydro-N-acetylmuramic acid kinase, partial [Chloroflexota bacterium]